MTYTPTPAFQTAKTNVDNLTKDQERNIMLLAYSLFKQTTVGDVQGARPGVFSLKERTKFDAWTLLKGKTHEETDRLYVNCSNHMVEGEQLDEENQRLLGLIDALLRIF